MALNGFGTPGENKSWALITFDDVASAQRAKDEGVAVLDAAYEEVQLRVQFSDVEGQLKRNTGGFLSQVRTPSFLCGDVLQVVCG